MWLLFLFADTPREDPLRRPEVIWGVAGLVIALLVGAAVIAAVDKWRKRAAAAPTEADATAALTSYREMYENGEITEEEYAKLRNRVAEKVKAPVPPKPAPPPASSTGTRPADPGTGYFADPPSAPPAPPSAPPTGTPDAPPPV